jgi:plasmid stabilization system protein ParE
MRGYRLSPQAELTFEDIISWGIEHFGIGQAERYKHELISRLSALAADELPHGIPKAGNICRWLHRFKFGF